MNTYFKFTRRQKIGVVSLSIIIILLVVALNVNNHQYLPDPTDVNVSHFQFGDAQKDSSFSQNSSFTAVDEESKSKAYDLFEFNPNELEQDGWENLGFSAKQAESIINYRSNYGPFNQATDLKKLYVISDEKYTELEPYIVLPEINKLDSDNRIMIEINTATQLELESIRGIGPTFAKRTIKYRQLLGGYVDKEQFHEIYGMNEDAFEALSENTSIDLNVLETININTDSKEKMKKHPYLKDWEVIATIIEERGKRKLENLDFLIDKDLMNQNEVDKLTPYINF
jgi:competence protein ComEA